MQVFERRKLLGEQTVADGPGARVKISTSPVAEALLPGLPALEELGSLNIQQQSQTRHGVKEGGTGPGAKNPGLCWGRPLGSKAPQSAGKLTSCVSGKVLARGRSGPPFFPPNAARADTCRHTVLVARVVAKTRDLHQ